MILRRRVFGTRLGNLDLLFGFFLLLHVSAIWLIPVFPSQDGPAHAATAVALIERILGGPSSFFGTWYELNSPLLSGWLPSLLLGTLSRAIDPFIAEKLLLSLHCLSLPICFRICAKSISPSAYKLVSLSCFPLIFSFPLIIGFYPFCLSLSPLLLSLGWLFEERPVDIGIPKLTGWFLLIASLHLFSAAVFLVAVTLVFAHARIRQIRFDLLPLLTVLLAGAAVFGPFIATRSGGTYPFDPAGAVRDRFALRMFAPFPASPRGYAGIEPLICLAIVAAQVLFRPRARVPFGRVWPVLTVTWLFAWQFGPTQAWGASYLPSRFQTVFFLFLLLGFGRIIPRNRTTLVTATLCLVNLMLFAGNVSQWRSVSRKISAYLDHPWHSIPPNQTILALSFEPMSQRTDLGLVTEARPLLHASGWIAAASRGVDLSNYQPAKDHFPIRYRHGRNPLELFSGDVKIPGRGCALPSQYEGKTRERIDYVFLWKSENLIDRACQTELTAELGRDYELIFEVPHRGRLFRSLRSKPDESMRTPR